MIYEQEWDRKLNICTSGRDDSLEDAHHFPYEPTPYTVLDRLVESGWIRKENHFLDYGCGKGRVCFYLAARVGCSCIGIDFSEGFIAGAEANLASRAGAGKVSFFRESAERYRVPEDTDRFFFFNPFSVKVLQSAVRRILESWYAFPRHMLLMFYYPSDEYVAWLMGQESLCFYDEADCSDLFPGDARERIMAFEIPGGEEYAQADKGSRKQEE